MAKKTNRTRTRKPVVETPVESKATEPTPPVASRAARPAKSSRSQTGAERLEDEYAYITGDLRRVLIVAAVMFVLLIALNIIFDILG